MIIKTIEHLINFIYDYNITDKQTINELCEKSIGKTFPPFNFEGDEKRTKEYFIYWITNYQDRLNKGLELPIWLGVSAPFDIKDFYNNK